MWIHRCRSVENYEKLNKIEEGTYGIVYRARDRQTGEIVALKQLKLSEEREGFPVTSLREINALMSMMNYKSDNNKHQRHHPHIIPIREMVVGRRLSSVFLVMPYMPHDLRSLMEEMQQPFRLSEVKTLLQQLLSAVAHMHGRYLVHRDLKTSNLLLSHSGHLMVADFGMARRMAPVADDTTATSTASTSSSLKGPSSSAPLTPVVVTLWYRAPEVLLGATNYAWPVDLWSVGCIMAELILGRPIFPGTGELDQLDRIFTVLGLPTEQIWPGWRRLPHASHIAAGSSNSSNSSGHQRYPPFNSLDSLFPALSPAGLDLMKRLLCYDPQRRITAQTALGHPFFQEAPLPKDPSVFPTWPSRSEA